MTDSIDCRPNGDAATFSGPSAVAVFQMAVIASGLRLYAKTGIRPNRAYTPSAMVRTARVLLGADAPKIGARDYFGWADALTAKVQTEQTRIAADNARAELSAAQDLAQRAAREQWTGAAADNARQRLDRALDAAQAITRPGGDR